MAGALLAALLVVAAPRAAVSAPQAAASRPLERRAPPAPAPGPDLGTQFLGEGGSYQAPDGAAGDYLEHADRPLGPTSPLPSPARTVPARTVPPSPASPAAPVRTFPGPERRVAPPASPLPRGLAARRPVPTPSESAPRPGREQAGRGSLWQGLAEPLELPPGEAGERELGEAEGAARRDYESRVLGARLTRDLSASAPEPPPPDSPDGTGALFASVSLKEGPEVPALRDAVAALSAAVSFRPHPGAAPSPGSLSGWLPAAGLGELLRIPWVARVELGSGPGRAAAPKGASSRVLVGIRLRPGEPPDRALSRVLGDLGPRAGLEWRRSVGLETLPGTGERALVVLGEVPVRGLSRVMAHPEVLKIAPAAYDFSQSAAGPPSGGGRAASRLAPGVSPASPRSARLLRFIDFILTKAPLLLLLTALALIPAAGDWLIALLKFFIPYR